MEVILLAIKGYYSGWSTPYSLWAVQHEELFCEPW